MESVFNDTIKFKPDELTASAVITTISSLLSILGGFVLIWSYYVVPSTRNTVRLMLIALTLADIISSFGYLMASVRWYVIGMQSGSTSVSESDDFCKAQRSITTVALRMGVLGRNESVQGINGVWCWLSVTSNDRLGILWMCLAGKGWEILTYLITATLYILLKRKGFLNKKRRRQFLWNQISAGLRREDELFCFTWLILYCLRMWGTVRFFLDIAMVKNHNAELAFLMLQSYGDSAQAFWNFILFCVFDHSVRCYILGHYSNSCGNKSTLRNNHDNIQESIERPDMQHNDEERPLLRNPRFSETRFMSSKKAKTV
ncbi:GPR157 [Mytilus coruscus]|uniref:GPR157 n=1 Tax=Mytilus coruscus TaxID=42192 RepID=A0A6J8BE98_MYTCO|nr:GPR157 [Mytilus coruscus]